MSADDVANAVGGSLSGGVEPARTTEAVGAIVRELVAGLGDNKETAELVTEIAGLRAASERQAETVSANTDAVAQNTTARSGGESALASAGKSAGSMLSAGYTVSPLISGLFRLFGGGDSEQEEIVLPSITRPASIRFENVYSQRAGELPDSGGETGPRAERQAQTQITVQVQAMDSRSFLDHRDEIARAVRNAMLNSNSLNDVVNEL